MYLDNYYRIPIGSAPDLVLVKAFFDDGWIMDAQGKNQTQQNYHYNKIDKQIHIWHVFCMDLRLEISSVHARKFVDKLKR